MTKELIISANVHEKKVAILEDGLVTEFYVERRDENQGVVGNLYKGRVMKVLPGMQSAFVDIGLERDAFLYVSDFTEFMEEEEEIDFKEMGEESRGPARAEPRRGERPRPGIVSPPAKAAMERARDENVAERPVRIDDAVEQLAEIADESVIPPPVPDEEIGEEVILVGPETAEAQVLPVEELIAEPAVEHPATREPETMVPVTDLPEETVYEQGDAEVEAVEEKPKRGRSRKKGAGAEPKKTTRGRKKAEKVEAKAETGKRKAATKSAAKKNSRKRGEAEAAGEETKASEPGQQFERVTDEDLVQEAGELLKDAIVQEKIIEQAHTAEYETAISPPEPEPEWRVGSFRSQIGGGSDFQRIVDEAADLSADVTYPNLEPVDADVLPAEDVLSVPPLRHISELIPGDLYERSQSASGEIGEMSGIAASGEASDRVNSQELFDTSGSGEMGLSALDEAEDRDAEVRDLSRRAEFAVRRGGRGRRRRREPQAGTAAAAADEEKSAPVAVAEQSEEEGKEVQRVDEKTRAGGARRQETRYARRPDGDRRINGQRRADQSRRSERAGPPTISELLHEGQEILVQIAKEPIAKKGARITSHMALPGRYLVYMPTVNHVGVSRKIPNEAERIRLKRLVAALRDREAASGGFIARTACAGHTEQELQDDMRYLLRTWADVRRKAERVKSPALVHRDLDLVQRILRDQLSEEFSAIRVDNEVEYARIVEFVNRVQPKLVKRVKLYVGDQPIFEKYGVQPEIDKAVRPRVWLKSGGYIVINQTEALVAIDVNTGKFVGKSDKLEDTITRTNLEAAKEIVRQVRLRDLGGIIVIDFIDMEERKNRQRVMVALQQELQTDRAPSKILSINDFGLMAITRKRVKQSLERTLCTPCPYCQGAGMVKSPQTVCFEILEQAKAMAKQVSGSNDVMLRVSPDVAEAFHTTEAEVLEEIEAYFGTPVTIEADLHLHQEQYDFAVA